MGILLPLVERLFAQRRIDKDGCWLWTGLRVKDRYGRRTYGLIRVGNTRTGGRCYVVHRLAAFLFKGWSLDDTRDVCHSCDVPHCFNPIHLFLGTRLKNMRDAKAKGRTKNCGGNGLKTQCKRGHPFTPENVYLFRDKKGRLHRNCIPCRNMHNAAWQKAH